MAAIEGKASGQAKTVWSSVTESDTASEAAFPGGKALVEVNGTFDSATVSMHFGTVSGSLAAIDTDAPPDGADFTAAGMVVVELPPGFIQPVISGGGASQDIDIIVTSIPQD